MAVTIKDIVGMAKVSHTIVSRVLKDSPETEAEAKKRIKELANCLNYMGNTPNMSFGRNFSDCLGLIVPDVINPYYSHICQAVEDIAGSNNYGLIICSSDRDPKKELKHLQFLREKRVDGIIIGSASIAAEPLRNLARNGTPLVFIDNWVPGVVADFITTDHYMGATQAVKHLIRLGYRRIAHFCGPVSSLASQERKRAYFDVLKENHLEINEKYIIPTRTTFNDGIKAARALLQLNDLPEAVFTVNDMVAIGALKYLYHKGINVPADLALIGYDDIDMAAMLPVPLTTIYQCKIEVGKIAAQTLLERIATPTTARQVKRIILQPHLVIRKSCGENEERKKELFTDQAR